MSLATSTVADIHKPQTRLLEVPDIQSPESYSGRDFACERHTAAIDTEDELYAEKFAKEIAHDVMYSKDPRRRRATFYLGLSEMIIVDSSSETNNYDRRDFLVQKFNRLTHGIFLREICVPPSDILDPRKEEKLVDGENEKRLVVAKNKTVIEATLIRAESPSTEPFQVNYKRLD